MYHSVTIGDKNTWEDWRLIPGSPPTIPIPAIKKKFVELPAGNGSIDLTGFLANGPYYGMREGTWEFAITDQERTREETASMIAHYLHGKRFEKIVLEDDPEHYYSGRLEFGGIKVGKTFSTLSIAFTIDTFKHKLSEYHSAQKEDII